MEIRPLTRKTVALIRGAVRNITIEPCFFLFAMNYGFYIVVARALYINKVNIICSYKLKEYVILAQPVEKVCINNFFYALYRFALSI